VLIETGFRDETLLVRDYFATAKKNGDSLNFVEALTINFFLAGVNPDQGSDYARIAWKHNTSLPVFLRTRRMVALELPFVFRIRDS